MVSRRTVTLAFLAGLVAASNTSTGAEILPSGDPVFHVPPGFVVQKVAGPPLVRYPLFAAFDDRGRLFVAEGTGTNLPGEELRAKKLGRILVLEDLNGDGMFDTSRVFAGGLVAPQGVLWHDGAVYTASHPSLWRLEDPANTGAATRRVELVSGFGFNGNGCDLHGPFLGPDGRLYWTDGRHGYKVKTKEGEILEGLAARIWRCKTDGSEVERICGGGFDNPVEIAFTPEGEAIGTMDQAPGDCLLHYVEGGVYPMEHPCLKEFPMTGPLLGAVQQYTPVLPAALCGLARYRSQTFGTDFQDTLLSTHYMTHKIVRHELARAGSTFRAEDSDFLTTTTHDVRLTDVLEDADGSVLFVDMGAWFTYGFPGNPSPKPDALGAIYRIRRSGAPQVDDPWGKRLNISSRPAKELVPLLDDPRPMVRDQVGSRLARLGPDAVPELCRLILAEKGPSEMARRNAVWALCRIGSLEACGGLGVALRDPAPSVRLAAIRAVGLLRTEEAMPRLLANLTDGSAAERRASAEALGRIGKPAAVAWLLPALAATDLDRFLDPFLEHAILYALIRINDRGATLPSLAANVDGRQRRGALIALDQMKDGRLTEADVAPLLSHIDAPLQRLALEVVARHPEWSKLTVAVLRPLLTGGLDTRNLQIVINIVSRSGADAAIQDEVTQALARPTLSASSRSRLLWMMARCPRGAFPAPWVKPLEEALAHPDLAVRRAAVSTIKARHLTQLDRPLAEFGRDGDQPADLRIAALECVAGRLGPPDPAAFVVLVAQLAEGADPLQRLAAARTLGACPLSSGQQLELAAGIERAGTLVLRLLLPLFAKGGDSRVGAALVDALGRAPAADALSPAELDQTLEKYPAAIRERAERLRMKLVALQQDKTTYLGRLSAELEPLRGDPDAGQELFLSQKVSCYGCHRAVGRGGTVGPDLSRIGKIRTQAELLESIVFPGRTIAPEYRAYHVATKNGRVATGVIVGENSQTIILRATDLAETHLWRSEIEAMTPSTASVMPEGLEKVMTRQELRDLLEFLCRQQ